MNSKNPQRGHLSVADAQAEVLRHADRRTVETVTLDKALGRVLVEDIRSNRDQPPYDVSAMDGFAVRSADAQQGRARAFALIDHTQLCSITSNLGDVKTTITHPASTSHGRLTEDQRQAAGIGQGLIRVAVGLEHMDDIQTDLARGLETLA